MLPPIHISSKPKKRMNLKPSKKKGYPPCDVSIVSIIQQVDIFHTTIYEGVKFWTNIFIHVDYLVLCTFSIWHYLKSDPCFFYLFLLLFLATPYFVVVVQLCMNESQLKKSTKSKKKWHTWVPPSGLVISPIKCAWMNSATITVWYLSR